ncbi:hypothetical protein LSUE1_G007575 [Lachnellula suecica]|uniref:Uncharacterized protein n=1 Tax=Lachnellula suecica TaxID=602035 RepID=A0A8T9C210_9HELO|nr:hypothetical protein LSUE1_G007575 [Lachnellula suecica]
MANWEPQNPPRTSAKWLAPGIFVNVEFGLSFSNDRPPHTASMKYTSRNMQERTYRQQQESFRLQQPPNLPGDVQERQSRQERPRNLDIRPRAQHERGSSAPPSIYDRNYNSYEQNQPFSPVSPLLSPLTPLRHTGSMPIERTNRPLPTAPSRFRLGEDGLPWSTEPWYLSEEAQFAGPTGPVVGIELEERRREDPQRVRELGNLHQAMMTVDSLHYDGWEAWTWDSVGDIPRGPRSLGWAVRREPNSNECPRELLEPPPPPYVVSQWEQAYGRRSVRPHSALS